VGNFLTAILGKVLDIYSFSGVAFIALAAWRKTSGKGLPFSTSSIVALIGKKLSRLSILSTVQTISLEADEATAILISFLMQIFD